MTSTTEQVQAARALSPQILAISQALLHGGLDATAQYMAQAPTEHLRMTVIDGTLKGFLKYGETEDFWRSVLVEIAFGPSEVPRGVIQTNAHQPAPVVKATPAPKPAKKTRAELSREYRARRAAAFDPNEPKNFLPQRTELNGLIRQYVETTGSTVVDLRKRCLLLGVDVSLQGFYWLNSPTNLNKPTLYSEKTIEDLSTAVKLILGELKQPVPTPEVKAEPVPAAPVRVTVGVPSPKKDDVSKPEFVKPSDRVRVVTALFEERGRNVVVTQSEIAKLLDISVGAVHQVMRNVRDVAAIGGGRFTLR